MNSRIVVAVFLCLVITGCLEQPKPDEYYSESYRMEKLSDIAILTNSLITAEGGAVEAYLARRGDFYQRVGMYEESQNDLKAVNTRWPGLEESLESYVDEKLSEPELAVSNINKAIANCKKGGLSFQDCVAARATLSALLSKPDIAVTDIDSLFVRGFASQHSNYSNLKAAMFIQQGHLDKALSVLDETLAKSPRNRVALALRAKVYLKLSQLDKALLDANANLSLASLSVDRFLNPAEASVLYLRAMIYSAMNKPKRVVADMRMAQLILKQNEIPENVSLECAKLLAKSGNEQAALQLVDQDQLRLTKQLDSLAQFKSSLKKLPQQ